ncbi:MAG: hypothetical protein KGK03_09715 [Candidatus Omnitrophica bacterium]|nr:hypothetical protein [Candidatus Omnitrophota bacterium]
MAKCPKCKSEIPWKAAFTQGQKFKCDKCNAVFQKNTSNELFLIFSAFTAFFLVRYLMSWILIHYCRAGIPGFAFYIFTLVPAVAIGFVAIKFVWERWIKL